VSEPNAAGVLEFLREPTPDAWFAAAPSHLDELLIDHANCEKKAASTALSLTYKYVDRTQLLHTMSRLAREELRHFEQVLDLMDEVGITYRHLTSAGYARALHAEIRSHEPGRLVDTLICGAVVEARSCERFAGLIDVLPCELGALYRQLLNSEARHFRDYLDLAREAGGDDEVACRTEVFLAADAEFIRAPDSSFRFHSGMPA
jgi:tRNA-(ms[2]io[6]A)-hydroxylase